MDNKNVPEESKVEEEKQEKKRSFLWNYIGNIFAFFCITTFIAVVAAIHYPNPATIFIASVIAIIYIITIILFQNKPQPEEIAEPPKKLGAILVTICIIVANIVLFIYFSSANIPEISIIPVIFGFLYIIIIWTGDTLLKSSTVNTTITTSAASTAQTQQPAQPQFPQAAQGTPVVVADYPTFVRTKSEDVALRNYINMTFTKNKLNANATLPYTEKRKNILTIIYCLLVYIVTTLFMAYHTHPFIVIIFLIVLTIFYIKMSRGKVIEDILIKEIKARPDEKMENIIVSKMQEATENNNIFFRVMTSLVTVALILLVFFEPHMIFENTPDGYYLRYYTLGIFNNPSDVKVPAQYKNKDVVGIRGSVFENMIFIKNVQLPETIKEIRGDAFKNCINLESINLPLQLKEIHGSTFENCSKLKAINIPEGVKRIGGSAFRNDSNLSEVVIPKSVTEIGSSAFRATNIQKVCISKNAYVNERAFKETYPTIVYYENNCQEDNVRGEDNEWGEYE